MSEFRKLVESILQEYQLVIYRTYADQPYLNDIKGSFFNKPTGCLWGCRDDSWKNWCNEEEFRCSDNYFEWTLKPGTKIFTIDSIKDFLYLLKHYSEGIESYRNKKDYYIDFLKVSKDYDAVELTQNGNSQLHYQLILDDNSEFNDNKYKAALNIVLNTWDVPSICVFYPKNTVDVIQK